MLNSIFKLITGDLEDKRVYRQMMKRVDALPNDYRYTFRKIQHYMFSVGPIGNDITIFTHLLDLFEACAAEGRKVLDVIGSDVSKFCDEYMHASSSDTETRRKKLNKEILEYFNRKEQ